MSKKEKIYYRIVDDLAVEFFKVVRSTTHTCDVKPMRSELLSFSRDYRIYVPGKAYLHADHERCHIVDENIIEHTCGESSQLWSGKPISLNGPFIVY